MPQPEPTPQFASLCAACLCACVSGCVRVCTYVCVCVADLCGFCSKECIMFASTIFEICQQRDLWRDDVGLGLGPH